MRAVEGGLHDGRNGSAPPTCKACPPCPALQCSSRSSAGKWRNPFPFKLRTRRERFPKFCFTRPLLRTRVLCECTRRSLAEILAASLHAVSAGPGPSFALRSPLWGFLPGWPSASPCGAERPPKQYFVTVRPVRPFGCASSYMPFTKARPGHGQGTARALPGHPGRSGHGLDRRSQHKHPANTEN